MEQYEGDYYYRNLQVQSLYRCVKNFEEVVKLEPIFQLLNPEIRDVDLIDKMLDIKKGLTKVYNDKLAEIRALPNDDLYDELVKVQEKILKMEKSGRHKAIRHKEMIGQFNYLLELYGRDFDAYDNKLDKLLQLGAMQRWPIIL